MASSRFLFRAWSPTGGAGNSYAYANVNWSYSGSTITIHSVSFQAGSYGWRVASAMKLAIRWTDGAESVLADGTYNWCGGNMCINVAEAGFVTKSGVLGIFSDGASRTPVSHTFSGTSGGFRVWFGSTASTINEGNPQPYKELPQDSGDSPNATFARAPGGASVSLQGTPTCTSASIRIAVSDAGVGSTMHQRLEYSTSSNFSSYSTTDYTSDTAKTYNLSGLRPATTYYYRSYAYNDAGWVNSGIGNFRTKGQLPVMGTPTATNPEVYRLVFNMPSVKWDTDGCASSGALVLHWSYTADGNTYSFSKTWSNMPTSATYDTTQQIPTTSQYFREVPDDETVTYYWEAISSIGTTTTAKKTIYCQKSYTTYVIEQGVNSGQPVEADLYVSPSSGTKPTSVIRRIQEIS